jgi:serpin B
MKPSNQIPYLTATFPLLLLTSILLAQQPAALSDVVSGNNAFAFDLYAKLKSAKGNIFFSPYSISTALAMTYAGARGNTEKQMMQALHFGKNEKSFHEGFGALQARINDVQKKGDVKLSVANSLWMQKDYRFLPEFLDMTSQNYEAGFNYVDYRNEPEKARVEINKWVEGKTNDKITNLIQPGVLNDSTKMVLADAIYFKGAWANKFLKPFTTNMPFWFSSKDSVIVKMMIRGPNEFDYFENDSIKCISLPYTGNSTSMVIILPMTRNGFKSMEGKTSAGEVSNMISRMKESSVKMYLPKFRTTKDFMLNKELYSMGLRDAFVKGNADFSAMTGNKELNISAVIHKAFVDVDEEGTEAAAATAGALGGGGAPPPPKKHFTFRADHPFLFLIRDNTTGIILFMGRILNPVE